ncbi:MAG TPA: hypothetical protein VNK43_02050, partial [Gemmatimonadales bacterium]|nr:hypothetical protein [Gemmatimonadales bacterium]
ATRPAVVARLTGEQALEVVFVRWEPSTADLHVAAGALPATTLRPEELERLRDAGVRGRLVVQGSILHGRGPGARAIVVLQRQLAAPVELRQPDRADVIYLQSRNGWRTLPTPGVPTVDRVIRLGIAPHDSATTTYAIEHADRTVSEGAGFVWGR